MGYEQWLRSIWRRELAQVVGTPERNPAEHRCPTCRATAGEPCRTDSGALSKRPHVARQRALADARPYALRHSFVSLLLHEGRSVIYVARQVGHGAAHYADLRPRDRGA